ncbi:MAG: sigma-70 family RNA polymerase sigma factor [Anaerolineae bacterium]|nr:sigma-70 family RNA polymerase sigma factor [Anaerolineae bacterium]
MADRTNQEWLDALREPGQTEALADLRALLLRGLRSALPDVPEESREDFAQEALLKILDNLDSFRGESRFTTWAYKIAIHVAFTELRRRRWRNVSLQDLMAQYDEGDFTLAVLADPAPSPEQRVTQQMLLDMVRQLIAEELTDRQRQAMVAAVFGGMPLQEIARQMDTNCNALYKLLYDARQRLQRQMLARGVSMEDLLEAFEV